LVVDGTTLDRPYSRKVRTAKGDVLRKRNPRMP
jgi:hypothetical protein